MSHKRDDPDFLLALVLQSELNQENRVWNTEKKNPKRSKSPIKIKDGGPSLAKKNRTTSLIDPNLEIHDPTPDIHSLFLKFNITFFWNTLVAVEVRWSPRMYSCAGLCSYEGRRGLCSIRLSEPLLKLRPRSDLVETLLHEMIHAYLFVTNNNRDRDGHGPEFKKHMCRINQAAGTNITIYHSFHDEVKLYQKHWWRCDGPCQNKPPFYGMVKRTMNRAPGPNDFWWTTHQATCGGTYIKVREPTPKNKKTKAKIGNIPKKSNIRDFFTKPSSNSSKNVMSINDLNKLTGSTGGAIKKTSVNSSATSGIGNYTKSPVNGVVGFNDLHNQNKSGVNRNIFGGVGKKLGSNVPGGMYRGGATAVMNKGTGTITVKPKLNSKAETNSKTETKTSKTFTPFSTSGHRLGGEGGNLNGNSKQISPLVFNFFNKPIPKSEPDKISSDTCKNYFPSISFSDDELAIIDKPNGPPHCSKNNQYSPEKYKDEFLNTSISDDELADVEEPKCQNCSKSSLTPEQYKNEFLSITISDDELADVEEPKCQNGCKNSHTPEQFKDEFFDKTNSDDDLCEVHVDGDDFDDSVNDMVQCPVCNFKINRYDMSIHLQSCDILDRTIENMTNSANLENDEEDDDINIDKNPEPVDDSLVPCPCCSKYINANNINKHLDECLSLLAIKEFEKEF